MNDFDITLSLNSKQIEAHVHTYEQGDKTIYDITFEDQTLSIFKDTLYTWATDDSKGLSQADVQSIGEQIQQ